MTSPKFKKGFVYGKRTLPANVFYAPLAGCSDFPFRKMSARYQPGLMFCEMVKMEALIRQEKNTLAYLDYCQTMRPIGAQIVGSNPALAAPCAKIIEDRGFDVVDFNCGCPVDKVTKDGSGSGMLKNPERIGEIISQMVHAVNIPVTVKIRAGWDQESINAVEIAQIAEAAGATAIAIHGRTRSQAYRGKANWDYIKAAKEATSKILVIGNGDLFSAEDAKNMWEHTGCDAVLFARGTMGQPWIAEDVLRLFSGENVPQRTVADLYEALQEHIEHIASYCGEGHKAFVNLRRIGCWYFKRVPNASKYRAAMSRVNSFAEAHEIMERFSQEVSLNQVLKKDDGLQAEQE